MSDVIIAGLLMSGISTVMEVIANRAYDDDFAEKFSNEFTDNILRSRENV